MNEPASLQPAIRVVMMPRDTNPMGTIFGGIILSYIDWRARSRRASIRTRSS